MREAGHVARTGREKVYTGFWWRNLRETDYFEDPGVDGKIIFSGNGMRAWTGVIWLRIWTDGGYLLMRFHKMRGIS
jgi:hypothetical protein